MWDPPINGYFWLFVSVLKHIKLIFGSKLLL
jgi:hypothetical protein